MKKILPGSLIILMLGCGTSTLKVDTNPSGANVFATTVGANDRHLIGKTPLPRTLTKDIQKGQMGALMLDIELERYQNTSILIVENGNSESEISLQLKSIPVEKKVESDKKDESEKKDETAKKAELDPVQVNKNLDQLFEAQRLARIGRFEDSLKLLDEVGKVFPKWASVSEMRGGIFLLQKKYGNALDEYQKSLSLNSENTNILAIIKNLEKRMGAKSAENQTTNSLTDPKSKQ